MGYYILRSGLWFKEIVAMIYWNRSYFLSLKSSNERDFHWKNANFLAISFSYYWTKSSLTSFKYTFAARVRTLQPLHITISFFLFNYTWSPVINDRLWPKATTVQVWRAAVVFHQRVQRPNSASWERTSQLLNPKITTQTKWPQRKSNH